MQESDQKYILALDWYQKYYLQRINYYNPPSLFMFEFYKEDK